MEIWCIHVRFLNKFKFDEIQKRKAIVYHNSNIAAVFQQKCDEDSLTWTES